MDITKLVDDLAGGAPVTGPLLLLAAETLEALRVDLEAVAVAARALNIAVVNKGVGGCAEVGHGWSTCQLCFGHPEHKADCPFVVIKKALARPGVKAVLP